MLFNRSFREPINCPFLRVCCNYFDTKHFIDKDLVSDNKKPSSNFKQRIFAVEKRVFKKLLECPEE